MSPSALLGLGSGFAVVELALAWRWKVALPATALCSRAASPAVTASTLSERRQAPLLTGSSRLVAVLALDSRLPAVSLVSASWLVVALLPATAWMSGLALRATGSSLPPSVLSTASRLLVAGWGAASWLAVAPLQVRGSSR